MMNTSLRTIPFVLALALTAPAARAQTFEVYPEGFSYQVWFRNAVSLCTPGAFNLSNGFTLGWAP